MDELEVEVSVGEGASPAAPPALVEAAVRHVLQAEGVTSGELSVALVGDAEIRALNHAYLGRDYATDVVAFHLHEAGEPPLGDVYLGVEQAERQAAEYGATPREEVLRLAIHGTLHVLGWDHPEGDDRTASAMFERQESLLREFLADAG
jgi:rRNA maturation RNase YbeY